MKPPSPAPSDEFDPALPPDCQIARASMQNRLDGNAQPELETVQLHRAQCADCKALNDAARLLIESMPALGKESPDSRFADRVLAQFPAPARLPWYKRRFTWAAGFALAASVLIAVLVIVREQRQALAFCKVAIAPVRAPIEPPINVKVAEKPVPLRDSLQEASAAVSALTRKAANDNFGFKLPKWSLANTKVNPLPNPDSMAALQQVRHSAQQTIAPITDSTRRALDAFWRELGP